MSPSLPHAFMRLAWSNLAAQSAEQISLAAAAIVAVLALGAGAGETGLLQTAQTLPLLLLSIPAGVLVDRMSRPHLMAAGETLRVLSLLGILALASQGLLSLWLLAAIGFLGACGTVVLSVAAPALVPTLVPAPARPVANGRIELARTVAFAAGPALGGILVGWTGAGVAFGLAAALSFGAVILLAGINEPPRQRRTARHPLREIQDGAAFVFGHALLRPVFLTQFVFSVALFVVHAVYASYAIHVLALSATEVGMTLAALGIGMVMGALFAPRLMQSLTPGTIIAIGAIAGLIASGMMILTIWVPSALIAGFSFFLLGAGPILWVISTTTLRQNVTPPDLLGRAFAISSIAYRARPLGAALGAIVGGTYGPKRAS